MYSILSQCKKVLTALKVRLHGKLATNLYCSMKIINILYNL